MVQANAAIIIDSLLTAVSMSELYRSKVGWETDETPPHLSSRNCYHPCHPLDHLPQHTTAVSPLTPPKRSTSLLKHRYNEGQIVALNVAMLSIMSSFDRAARPRLDSEPLAAATPPTSVLDHSVVASIVGQVLIHGGILIAAVRLGKALDLSMPAAAATVAAAAVDGAVTGGVAGAFEGAAEAAGEAAGHALGGAVGNGEHEAVADSSASDGAGGTGAKDATKSAKKPSKFVPNHVSNNVFMVNLAQAVAVPLANYHGRPFMLEAFSYRPLVVSLAATLFLSLACVTGYSPALTELLKFAQLPTDRAASLKATKDVVGLMIGTVVLPWAWTQFVRGRLAPATARAQEGVPLSKEARANRALFLKAAGLAIAYTAKGVSDMRGQSTAADGGL